MRPIPLVRFNALAGYCRHPSTLLYAEELNWFEENDEQFLAVLIRDRTDNDFLGIILGQDWKGRFRHIGGTEAHTSIRRVEALLRREIQRLSIAPVEDFNQAEEPHKPIDIFDPVVPYERLNRDFVKLIEKEGYSAARGIIEPMMKWYEDLDGNFVEQFQTTGFNARFWELYLFATFVEMGYSIERIHVVPDFTCVGIMGKFIVEAMTVNPTIDKFGAIIPPPQDTSEKFLTFQRNYMPIKFGSTLYSKLGKEYWKYPNVKDKPLLFAIQDFSAPASMLFTSSALCIYLYGYYHEWKHDNSGRLIITPRRIKKHKWGTKEIPSGFFDLPGAENITAVVFSNSGTISKFNRMGVMAGFGSRRVVLIREGFSMNQASNSDRPNKFRYNVKPPEYCETWSEGLNVYHNPRAIHPVNPEMLPAAAHHRLLKNGQIKSRIPDFHPLSSMTFSFVGEDEVEIEKFISAGIHDARC